MFPFTSGVSEIKRLTGKEKLSQIFCIYLVLLTKEFEDEVIDSPGRDTSFTSDEGDEQKRTSIITKEEYNKWVNVFEETLLLTSWIYNAQHPKIFFKGGRNSVAAKRIVQFVNMYKASAPRHTGMGLKIVKFHQLLHLWFIIKLYGSLLNVDGARGESNAIILTKDPGLRTQMRHLLLNLQTASERFRRDIILKCYKEMNFLSEDNDNEGLSKDDNDDEADKFKDPTGSRFDISFDYNVSTIQTKWKSIKMKGKECRFPQKINDAVFHKLAFYNGGYPRKRIASVEGFTEVKVKYDLDCGSGNTTSAGRASTNNNIAPPKNSDLHTIRACPSFRTSRPWFDWTMVKWSTTDTRQEIEAQVLMMLDMTTIIFEDCPTPTTNNRLLTETPHILIQSLQVAFIHSAKEAKTNTSHAGRRSALASWIEMEEEYQMVDLKCIDRPCFVIVDKFNDAHNGKFVAGEATDIISLLPKALWSNQFLDYNDTNLRERALSCKDEAVKDEKLKPYET